MRLLPHVLLAIAAIVAAPGARAETFHVCAGFIDSVPATITTQGVWCLRHDLSTAITSGNAITINVNNVTIDCNGFKLGGLAAGIGTGTSGIRAQGRQNTIVRNCNIRGFLRGIHLDGDGGGHLVEDNRLDNNTAIGISVDGNRNVVRRNSVFDSGGQPGIANHYGISASADILDNLVSGVIGGSSVNWVPTGIRVLGNSATVRNNRVSGLVTLGPGTATGIRNAGAGNRIEGNHVSSESVINGTAVTGGLASQAFCGGNTAYRYGQGITNCTDLGGNASL